MIKKALCIIIALVALVSVLSIGALSVSAQEATDVAASADEATRDEAELKISDEPKVERDTVNGTVIGYIGDASLDDKINVKDATAVQKHLAKLVILGEQAKHLGDADNNQKLNVRDATTIQKYIAGIEVKSYIWHLLYETGTHEHNFVEAVFEATCEKDGCTGYSCICGYEYTENIVKAKGHSYTAKVIEPTCETKGYTLYKCACGDNYKGNIVEKKSHSYSSKVVKPTCASGGYTLNECKVCGYSEKTDEVSATGKHKFNSNNICSVCKVKGGAFDALRDYLVNYGFYDGDTSAYYVYLPTGYDVDIGTVYYDELDDIIYIAYNLLIEDSVSTADVSFTKDSPYYSFRVSCPGVFSTYGPDNIKSDYTFTEPKFNDVRYFNYGDTEVPEDVCLDYSIDFINAALTIYTYYEDELPVTLSDLGFTNFEIG